ncbi:MAG: DUF4921 family protein [Candidatus Andersenbacteria bacterium]
MTTQGNNGAGQLRQDPITENWVVIATERSKRPDDFNETKAVPAKLPKYKDDCPFCNLGKYPQEPDVLRLPDDPEKWQVHIFGNKYPAFRPQEEFKTWTHGPYRATEAVGYHELLATRWHNQDEALVSPQFLALELEALILRFRQLRTKPSVNYIQIIRNHGKEAGASLEHPHFQIFTVPVLPTDISDLLHGAQRFAEKNSQKAFTVLLEHERSEQHRIVWENEHFTAFCPFASRTPFEMWIMPRESNPFFDSIDPEQRLALAEIMHQVLGRLYVGLNDPPYNYYIHSAPCDDHGFVCNKDEFPNFRWHIQILPRLTVWAGFELGTGLEINPTPPEEAAAFLREQKLPAAI